MFAFKTNKQIGEQDDFFSSAKQVYHLNGLILRDILNFGLEDK